MSRGTIAIGSDHAAFERKAELIDVLTQWDFDVVDCGTDSPDSVDYPDIAQAVCENVTAGECEKGIVICGTGIGISIAANKIEGIRCALCSEGYSARMAREHNDSNVLAMGARTIGTELAIDIMRIWLDSQFDGAERSIRRVDKIMRLQGK